jgi:hypothetical protein
MSVSTRGIKHALPMVVLLGASTGGVSLGATVADVEAQLVSKKNALREMPVKVGYTESFTVLRDIPAGAVNLPGGVVQVSLPSPAGRPAGVTTGTLAEDGKRYKMTSTGKVAVVVKDTKRRYVSQDEPGLVGTLAIFDGSKQFQSVTTTMNGYPQESRSEREGRAGFRSCYLPWDCYSTGFSPTKVGMQLTERPDGKVELRASDTATTEAMVLVLDPKLGYAIVSEDHTGPKGQEKTENSQFKEFAPGVFVPGRVSKVTEDARLGTRTEMEYSDIKYERLSEQEAAEAFDIEKAKAR